MKVNKIILLFIFCFLLFSSCIDDPVTEEKGTLKLNFNFVFDGQIIDNNTFDFSNNWEMQLTTLKIYFSNIIINNVISNTQEEIIDVYLVDFGDPYTSSNTIELESGSYNNFSLGVGLDSQTNSINPNNVAPDNPLHTFNLMHWANWNTYIFMKLDGKIDTTGNDNFNHPFTYHPGAIQLYDEINESFNFDIYPSLETEIEIVVDINKIFNPANSNNINIISQPSTHTFIDAQGTIDPLAIRFFENVVNAIEITY